MVSGVALQEQRAASHCGGFPCCRAQALGAVGSVVATPGFWSTGSVVVAPRLSCPTVCGVFLDQGSNPCLLRWQAVSLPLSHQGSPAVNLLNLVGEGMYWCNFRLCPCATTLREYWAENDQTPCMSPMS